MSAFQASRQDQLIESARSVLNQIEGGAALSTILPTARSVADLADCQPETHWMDCEIYGVPNVPGQETPLQTTPEKTGFAIFWKLHASENIGKITLDDAFKSLQKQTGKPPERNWLIPQSISMLEKSVSEFVPPDGYFKATYPDEALRITLLHSNHREILNKVRAYLHRFMATVWRRATEEKENLELLGPDYRLVVKYLDAMDSDVGNELTSALGLIRSENPADWSAVGLQCRNVILRLGRTLFPRETNSYDWKRLKKTVDLTGEKEENRLHAYLEEIGESMTGETADRLHELVDRIYETGSKGKSRALRQAEAQALVVDTFELVATMISASNLEPVAS